MTLRAPGSTCCGSTRLAAFLASQAISPCLPSAIHRSNCAADSGARADVNRHASKPSWMAFCRMRLFTAGWFRRTGGAGKQETCRVIGEMNFWTWPCEDGLSSIAALTMNLPNRNRCQTR